MKTYAKFFKERFNKPLYKWVKCSKNFFVSKVTRPRPENLLRNNSSTGVKQWFDSKGFVKSLKIGSRKGDGL